MFISLKSQTLKEGANSSSWSFANTSASEFIF